jgi:hypothetical protein
VRCWPRVRRIVREVLRPRAISSPPQAGDYGSFGPRAREDRRCPKLPRTPQEFSRRVPYICAHVFLGSDQRKDRGYRAGGPAHRVTKAKKEPMARRPLALNQHLCHQGQSRAVTVREATMTNRVSCNGVTISAVKSIDGIAVNILPHRLYPRWH